MQQSGEFESTVLFLRSSLPAALSGSDLTDDKEQPYTSMSEIAQEVVRILQDDESIDLEPFFTRLEQVLSGSTRDLRKQIVVGLLEDIQNISLNRNIPLAVFDKWLGDETLRAWVAVGDLWSGSMSPEDFNRGVTTGRWE